MNESQLKEGLLKAFESEGHRLVFWYDPEADFQDEVTGLALPDVQVMNMQSESALATKLKLELEDTTGKYLLYFPYAEPDEDRDWLLDIKLYSRCFYADRISIIFNDLELQQQGLRVGSTPPSTAAAVPVVAGGSPPPAAAVENLRLGGYPPPG